jgi:hypothetical protein
VISLNCVVDFASLQAAGHTGEHLVVMNDLSDDDHSDKGSAGKNSTSEHKEEKMHDIDGHDDKKDDEEPFVPSHGLTTEGMPCHCVLVFA